MGGDGQQACGDYDVIGLQARDVADDRDRPLLDGAGQFIGPGLCFALTNGCVHGHLLHIGRPTGECIENFASRSLLSSRRKRAHSRIRLSRVLTPGPGANIVGQAVRSSALRQQREDGATVGHRPCCPAQCRLRPRSVLPLMSSARRGRIPRRPRNALSCMLAPYVKYQTASLAGPISRIPRRW